MAPIPASTGLSTDVIVSFLIGASVTACLVLAVICARLVVVLNRKHSRSKLSTTLASGPSQTRTPNDYTNSRVRGVMSKGLRPHQGGRSRQDTALADAPASGAARRQLSETVPAQTRWSPPPQDTVPLYERIRMHKMRAPQQKVRLEQSNKQGKTKRPALSYFRKRSWWHPNFDNRSTSSFASFDVRALSRSASARLGRQISGMSSSSIPPVPTRPALPPLDRSLVSSDPLDDPTSKHNNAYKPTLQAKGLPEDPPQGFAQVQPLNRPHAPPDDDLQNHVHEGDPSNMPEPGKRQRPDRPRVHVPSTSLHTSSEEYYTVPLQYIHPGHSETHNGHAIHPSKAPLDTKDSVVPQPRASGQFYTRARYHPEERTGTDQVQSPVDHTPRQQSMTEQRHVVDHTPTTARAHGGVKHHRSKHSQRYRMSHRPKSVHKTNLSSERRTRRNIDLAHQAEASKVSQTATNQETTPVRAVQRPVPPSLVTKFQLSPPPIAGLANSPYETPSPSPMLQASEMKRMTQRISPPPTKPLPTIPRDRIRDRAVETHEASAHDRSSLRTSSIFSLDSADYTRQVPSPLFSTRLGMRAASSDMLRSKPPHAPSLRAERTYSGSLQYIHVDSWDTLSD